MTESSMFGFVMLRANATYIHNCVGLVHVGCMFDFIIQVESKDITFAI
jgi:hypothetical protein